MSIQPFPQSFNRLSAAALWLRITDSDRPASETSMTPPGCSDGVDPDDDGFTDLGWCSVTPAELCSRLLHP